MNTEIFVRMVGCVLLVLSGCSEKNLNNSHGTYDSDGTCNSDGTYRSGGTCNSHGTYGSDGTYSSNGTYSSDGTYYSHGTYGSDGTYGSEGTYHSDGTSFCFGLHSVNGVSHAIFMADKEITPTIFGKNVSMDRFNEVHNKLSSFRWSPTFTNALKLKGEGAWKDVDPTKIRALSIKEAWADMPREMEEYIISLPEFDAKIYRKVTERSLDNEFCLDNGKCASKETIKRALIDFLK